MLVVCRSVSAQIHHGRSVQGWAGPGKRLVDDMGATLRVEWRGILVCNILSDVLVASSTSTNTEASEVSVAFLQSTQAPGMHLQTRFSLP